MAPATPNARPSFATSATEPSDTPPVVPGRNHARIVAEIAQEFRPRLDTEGFSAVRNLGAQLRTGAVPCDEPAHTHKRCKMCGNVCHARMTSCSSCCLPFVDRGSWEPATMPRPGGDAYSETDSDTNSDDVDSEEEVNEEVTDSAAPAVDAASVMERRRRERRAGAADKSRQTGGRVTSNDNPADDATTQPWWRDWFGDDRLAPPTHPLGANPVLERAYKTLGVAPGTGEEQVRVAYRKCVRRVHPDSGGSPKELARVHDALEAIDADAWSHGAGAAALRESVLHPRGVHVASAETEPVKPRIFVSLAVYRDPEGRHTLRDAFDRATDPSRIFAGVHWQHILPKPAGTEPVPDRLHPEMHILTRQLESNCKKINDDERKVEYLTEGMVQQRENQRELDAKEAANHTVHSLDAADGTAWKWAGHVRETRESWESAEGPCRARHMSMRLWGGEEYVLHADSRTRFDDGWDNVLIAELERVANASGHDSAVLTGYPLGYHMRMTGVDNPETFERVGYVATYGRDDERESALSHLPVPLRRDGADDAPSIAAVGICGFGELLCYPAAVRLAPYDDDSPPLPAMMANPSFMFAPAEALVAAAPADLHAPFLYLGEELLTSARLWTKGWRTYLPRRCPLRVCYDPRHRTEFLKEDRRSGRQLYDHPRSEAARGTWDQLEERYFMNLSSRRRVLQVLDVPDPDSATHEAEDAVILKEPWNVGSVKPVKAFVDALGVDFDEREISNASRFAGLDRDALNLTYDTRSIKKKDSFAARTDAKELGDEVLADDGLPLRFKTGKSFEGDLTGGAKEHTERWN